MINRNLKRRGTNNLFRYTSNLYNNNKIKESNKFEGRTHEITYVREFSIERERERDVVAARGTVGGLDFWFSPGNRKNHQQKQ